MADKTKILSGAATLIIDGESIGYTRDGLGVTKGIEVREIQVDQEDVAVYTKVTGQTLEISTTLVEVTLDNIKIAGGEAATVTSNSLIIGQKTDSPIEFELEFYGKRMDGKYIKYTVPKAQVTTSGESRFSKDGEFLLPVTFKACYDNTLGGLAKVEELASIS